MKPNLCEDCITRRHAEQMAKNPELLARVAEIEAEMAEANRRYRWWQRKPRHQRPVDDTPILRAKLACFDGPDAMQALLDDLGARIAAEKAKHGIPGLPKRKAVRAPFTLSPYLVWTLPVREVAAAWHAEALAGVAEASMHLQKAHREVEEATIALNEARRDLP